MLDYIHRARPWQVGALLRKVLRYEHTEHEVGGFKLWLDPSSNFGYRMLTDGFIEPAMTKAIQDLTPEGGTFVDLGGNEGWFSLIAGRKTGPKGHVVCIEPQERLWPVIMRNFALNHMGHCALAPVAVGPEGRATMTLAPYVNTGASSMVGKAKPLIHRTQEVILRPLDDIVDEHGLDTVDVLKVDIEGFELNALRTAPRLLAEKRVKNVLIEFHEPQLRALGQSSDMIRALFAEHGYSHRDLPEDIHHFSA